ncbi:MAG TPA: tetratricopeptide repeat protein [Actinomycetota bacterium]|nr:tetratricopeptide repeat protein [Actinomycetota bacterium]
MTASSELPTGTVTFLFTDIEGSTRLLQELGERYRAVQDRHAEIMRRALAEGHEIRTEGDSFFLAFASPVSAVRAAVEAQRALASEEWPHGRPVRVRMGLHTGEGVRGGDDYLGIDVNRAARIAAAGHGGQVLLSHAIRGLIEHSLPEGVAIRDLGLHRLKDIDHPEHLHDLMIEGLQADFPPIRTMEARPTNLPPERTSFVGRGRERAEVGALLASTRLLTLTGPGGTGKTRLALRVAADRLDRFRDGVFLVDLSPLTDPSLVLGEIATALRILEAPDRPVANTVADHLRDREMLLVLDNMEQLVEAAPTVGRILDAAPSVRLLATSRVPLRITGEQEYQVRPLPLPRPEEVADLERLSTCESVALFVERAAAVQPGFRITAETGPDVAEIASRLDGLPLALELAASRVKLLGVGELSQRLEQRLPLLVGGARDLPERQRTLRGAIEWSHDLLEADQRRLFARLAVFAGGWTLDAAEAVCGPDLDVLEGLSSLVDASLVRRRETDGEVRFRMLETIREFAAERLAASGEGSETQRRHALHMRDLAEAAVPHLERADAGVWLIRLEHEHDNVRAALDWAERVGDVETAVRIAASLWGVWRRRGHLAESRARLERLAARPDLQRRDRLRVLLLGALASVAYWQHDYDRMAPLYEEALDIARQLGDRRLLAEALHNASFIPLARGQPAAGGELAHEALAEAQAVGDVLLEGRIRDGLAYQHMIQGDIDGALEAIREAVALHRREGQNMSLAESLNALAAVEYATGEPDSADRHVQEAFRIHIDDRNLVGAAFALNLMAIVAIRNDRPARAVTLTAASARWQEELGGGPPEFVRHTFIDPDAVARERLTDEEYERAAARGRAMGLDEAVAFALEEPSPG